MEHEEKWEQMKCRLHTATKAGGSGGRLWGLRGMAGSEF
jgi:hypothetical protein